MRQISAIILAILLLTPLALPATTQPSRIPTTQSAIDITGTPRTPLQIPTTDRAVILIFIASDCPISNAYAPGITILFETAKAARISAFTVYTDSSLTSQAARKHHDQYALTGDALLDPDHTLAHVVGAARTPEAVVVGKSGEILYRGRIDDLYAAIGRKRFAATTHELLDVLSAVSADRAVTTPWMPAVGCEIN